MLGTSLKFVGCMKQQHAVILGADLGNEPDYYSLSRLTDVTPHSCSDLLYFTLLLPFYLEKLFQVQLLFSLLLFWTKIFSVQFLFCLLFGQKYSKPNFNSAKIFKDNSKFCLSRKINPLSQKYSESQFLSDLAKFPLFCLPISYSCRWSVNSVN